MEMVLTDSFPGSSVQRIGAPGNLVWEPAASAKPFSGISPVVISDIPGYLQVIPREGLGSVRARKYPGFRIVLSRFASSDDYLRSHLGKSQHYSINRARKRLEEVFDVRYETYWGSMDSPEYHQLFDKLIDLIQVRASERRSDDDDWGYLTFYRDTFLDLIRKKKANCQVIRANGELVAIGFNLLAGSGAYGFIKSYNTDYSKFYPGLLSVVQLIDWCLQEGFDYLDMLKHDNPYKLEFSNDVYRYETHFLYKKNAPGQMLACRFAAFKMNLFYKILDWGKKRNLHLVYRQIKGRLINEGEAPASPQPETTLEVLPKPDLVTSDGMQPIQLDNPAYRHLKRAVYTYLFTAREPLKELTAHKTGDGTGAILLKGRRTAALLYQKH